jgi:hypothetical protein
MSSSISTSSDDSMVSIVKSRLVPGWLPIIVVALLILWLSGGIPPTSWRLLFQMFALWPEVQSEQGGGVFLSLVVVIAQALLILGAWIMLVIAIRREVDMARERQSQIRIAALQAKLAASNATETPSQSVSNIPNSSQPVVQPAQPMVPVAPDEPGELFDMSQAIFDLLPEEKEPGAESVEKKKESVEQEHVFVFGNPFEGELPEIFDYDTDLKRELQTMQKELEEQQDKKSKDEKAE